MKYGYININRGNAYSDFILNGAYYNGREWESLRPRCYLGYTPADAVRLYKALYGLTGKHNIKIVDNRTEV